MADLMKQTKGQIEQLLLNAQGEQFLLNLQDEKAVETMIENLTDEWKTKLILDIAKDKMKQQLDQKAKAEYYQTQFAGDVEKWLATKSEKSSKLYRYNLSFFTTWAEVKGKQILTLGTDGADEFIVYVKSLPYSDKTKLNIIAGVSSFYDYLGRIREVSNPFTNSPAMMKKSQVKQAKTCLTPSDEELDLILDFIQSHNNCGSNANKNLTLNNYYEVISFISAHGLRAGAIESAEVVRNNNPCKYYFKTTTKGKVFKIEITKDEWQSLSKINLRDYTSDRLKNYFQYMIKQMVKQGLIAEAYSIHDLRHYFAKKFYNETKDIHALQKLLNHSSIMTTEIYLKSLDVMD